MYYLSTYISIQRCYPDLPGFGPWQLVQLPEEYGCKLRYVFQTMVFSPLRRKDRISDRTWCPLSTIVAFQVRTCAAQFNLFNTANFKFSSTRNSDAV
jgi:hypothetical protein